MRAKRGKRPTSAEASESVGANKFIPNPWGRPPKELDENLVKALCAIHCTNAEIAAICGVSADTLERRKQNDPAFAQMMHDAKFSGKASMRRTMYLQAISGANPAFTLFWAKNHLGMSDKPEEDGPVPMDKARRIKEALDAIDGAVDDGGNDAES